MPDAAYQKRPKFFACKFVRLLTKKTVANELGPQAFTLLTVIVTTEDARGYTDPVTYFNEQLVPLVGLGSVQSLDRVRAKCVAAGWLRYIPGGRRSGPGRYWVVVPEKYADTDDRPTDEPSDDYTLFATGGEQTGSKPGVNRKQNEEQSGTYLPIPVPIPSSAASAAVARPKKQPRKEKKPRPADPLFDAVAEVTGLSAATARAHIGKVAAALREEDPPFTPDEVHEFGRRFPELCSWAREEKRPPNPGELQKYIGRIRAAGRPSAPRILTAADNPLCRDDANLYPAGASHVPH